jgi:small subunit ribosomal protein S1
MVLKVDKESQKISLGLKQIEPDPWSLIEQKYPVDTKLRGTVRNLTNFGAFVEIEEGIDGLLHISDMSWAKRVRHPNEMVKKGDEIDVVVLDISQEKKRISLGMKQMQENPWDALADEFAVDTEVEGTVTRLLDRGAVVELREDVEGFVPVGQMGKPDLKHPEDCFKEGDKLPMKVIKVDPKNKRIVLSVGVYLKGLSDEELEAFHEQYPIVERDREEHADAESTADAGVVEEKSPDAEVEVTADAVPEAEAAADADAAPEAEAAADAAPEAEAAADAVPEAEVTADAVPGVDSAEASESGETKTDGVADEEDSVDKDA